MSEPRLPNIGERVRMFGTLLRTEVIPPPPLPPPQTDWIFVDVDARVELRRGARVLEERGTYNDFHGSAVASAIAEAKEDAREEEITPQSEVELVVVEIRSQFRARPAGGDRWDRENLYAPAFVRFARLDGYAATRDLPEPQETDVWSTRLGDIPATSEVKP